MAKSTRKPKAKQLQRIKKENTQIVKESRVTKSARLSAGKSAPATPSKHGMRTRARSSTKSDDQQICSTPPNKTRPSTLDDAYYTSLSQEFKKSPKTPRSKRTSRAKKAVEAPRTPPNQTPREGEWTNITFVWDLLAPDRSFWDPIRETSSSQGSPGRAFAEEDINQIMKRLNRQVAHRIDNYKVENHGFMSSSSPSGNDPREQIPVAEEEQGELQLALFPSLQHVVELTGTEPRRTHTEMCYLDQFRELHKDLQDIWQYQGHAKAAPILFQLEAWKGGIMNWRLSHYTTGDERFSASLIDTHFQKWRDEVSAPASMIDYNMPDLDDSDLEMEMMDPRHYIDCSSPLQSRASPTPHKGNRRVMSALYDKDRDIGFLPTADQIQSYQAGETSSTTVAGLGMSDPGIIDTDSSDPMWDDMQFGGNGHSSIRIFEEGNVTPPQTSEPPGYTSSQASASSNKENDRRLMEQVMEDQRIENLRVPSPSNSNDNIDPADETWARNERLGEVWEMQMSSDY
ncbi:MAG: hypothetical protein Q9169_003419 [Polycauliona sp. 2 TL-2023]